MRKPQAPIGIEGCDISFADSTLEISTTLAVQIQGFPLGLNILAAVVDRSACKAALLLDCHYLIEMSIHGWRSQQKPPTS